MQATPTTVLRVNIQPGYYLASELDARVEVDVNGTYRYRLVLVPSGSWLLMETADLTTADPTLCAEGALSPRDASNIEAMVEMAKRLRDGTEWRYPDVDIVTVNTGEHSFRYAEPMDDPHRRFDEAMSHSFVRRVEDELVKQLVERHKQFPKGSRS